MRIPRRLIFSILGLWITAAARADRLIPSRRSMRPDAHANSAKPASTAAGIDDSPELMLFNDIPIVVAAGKREQTTTEAAASISVVTADDIELFNYESLAQRCETREASIYIPMV